MRNQDLGDGLPPGTRLQEFEIVRELGSGGFGITYLARDLSLDRLVAVKEYLPRDWGARRADGGVGPRSSTSSDDYAWGLERFLKEARILAGLNDRGIVRVYRIVEARGTAYMVMEHVDGRTLEEELRSSGPLPETRVRQLLAELAAGLAVVHLAGLLHRDLKPGNVMLRKEDGSPVLIDFGAARQHVGRQSRSLTAVLTPGYAPPEQYYAKGRQGPWTDVYALAAVAYEALSGRVPDEGPGRAMADELPPVEDVAAGPVSGELAALVARALQVEPDRRPQDMAEFMAALTGAGPAPANIPPTGVRSHEKTVSAGALSRDSPSPPPAERPKRRRAGALGLAAAVAAVLALWLGTVWRGGGDSPSARSPAADAEPPPAPARADSLASGAEDEEFALDRSDVGLVQPGQLEAELEAERTDSSAERAAAAERLAAERADSLARAQRAEVARTADSLAEAQRAEEAQRAAEARRLADLRRAGYRFRDCDACPEMVVIGPGTFRMGSPGPEEGRRDNEGPQRQVTIEHPFALGVHEVTFDDWSACVGGGGCVGYVPDDLGWGEGRRPVINVSWADAQQYVSWLSREAGEEYRLPSEAEWEYAARAGTGTARHWGEGASGQCRYANGADAALNSARGRRDDRSTVSCDDGYALTAPVGTYAANAWGLRDMLGNVSEWTEDCWHENYQGAPTHGGVWPGSYCAGRVLRGGSWGSNPGTLRSAGRVRVQAGDRNSGIGFRVARTVN